MRGAKRHFTKDSTKIVNGQMKKYSSSFIIRDVQNKTTTKYYLTPVKITVIKKKQEVLGGSREKGNYVHC